MRGGFFSTLGTLAIGGLVVLAINERGDPGSSEKTVAAVTQAGSNMIVGGGVLLQDGINTAGPVAQDALYQGRQTFGGLLPPTSAVPGGAGPAQQPPADDPAKKG